MEGGDRVAAGALPVWVVLGGRGVVRPVAGARAGRGPGGMAGRSRDDLLRCHHGGKALAVGELGFCKPWVRRGLFKTLTPVPGGLAFSLGAACVTVEKGQKTSLGEGVAATSPPYPTLGGEPPRSTRPGGSLN